MMSAQKTAVGTVDKEVLKKLSAEFDTRRITKGSQALLEIRSQIDSIENWQKSLSKLHNMAMYLLKDDDLQIPVGDQPIWELAEELADEIIDWKEKIDDIYDLLLELSELAPDLKQSDEDE